MSEFYYPKSRRELLDLLKKKFKGDKKLNGMSDSQLRAIRADVIRKYKNNNKSS